MLILGLDAFFVERLVALGDVIALAVVNNLVYGVLQKVLNLWHWCRILLLFDLRCVVHYFVPRHLDRWHRKARLGLGRGAQSLVEHLFKEEHSDLFHLGEAGSGLSLAFLGQAFFESHSFSGERHAEYNVITLM